MGNPREIADCCTENELTYSVLMLCLQPLFLEYMQFNSNSNFQLPHPHSSPITRATGKNYYEKYKGVILKAQGVNCNGYTKYVVNSEVLHTKMNMAESFCTKESSLVRQNSLDVN